MVALSAAACSSGGDDDVTATTSQTLTTAAGTDAPESPAPGASTAPATQPTGSQQPTAPPRRRRSSPSRSSGRSSTTPSTSARSPCRSTTTIPAGPTFDLHLARYNALDQDNKIGTLLVNPGGPGFGGSELAVQAADIYDRALRDRFDIIGWDPRGTGATTPVIDCVDDYDQYFAGDDTPQTDAERQQIVATDEQFAGRL